MNFLHDDKLCARNSVDADGMVRACRQFARLSDALGLPDTGQSFEEVVDAAIALVAESDVEHQQLGADVESLADKADDDTSLYAEIEARMLASEGRDADAVQDIFVKWLRAAIEGADA